MNFIKKAVAHHYEFMINSEGIEVYSLNLRSGLISYLGQIDFLNLVLDGHLINTESRLEKLFRR